MPSLDNDYTERYWEGEPLTGGGITHIAGFDRLDGEKIAACGRLVIREGDFCVPATAVITCLRCWYRVLMYPKLIVLR